MNKQPEQRSFRASELRVSPDGDGNTLTGYIAVTEQPTEILPGFVEILKRGCFTRSLDSATTNDVVALINHDADAPVGRLSAGTLQLVEDDKGLRFSVPLPNTTRANDLKVSIERRDVTGCSFGFFCDPADCSYLESRDGSVTRSISSLNLLEVSVGVTFPAYPQTSMSLRNLPDSMPVEMRSRFEARDDDPLPLSSSPQSLEPDWRSNTELRLRLAEAA
jgi:HK97 family phage prohead protease